MVEDSEIEIVFGYPDTDDTIAELQYKGFRETIIVRTIKGEIPVYFYHPVRLKQEIEHWIRDQNRTL